MAVDTLVADAFIQSQVFRNQVDDTIVEIAISYYNGEPTMDKLFVDQLSQVMTTPERFGFVPVMVRDPGWGLTYDAWAANPNGAYGAIFASVSKWFKVLTKYEGPVPV